MPSWIFQGNPDQFQMDAYLGKNERIRWGVRQQHLADEMQVGDTVFVWRAAGKHRAVAGVVAIASIVARPQHQSDDAPSEPLWTEGGPRTELHVDLKIEKLMLSDNRTITRASLRGDPILGTLRILRVPMETNYRLEPDQARRLLELC